MDLFLTLLAVLFIGLKLGGIIMWSWWLVMLPFYGTFPLIVVYLIIYDLTKKVSSHKKDK